MEMDEDKFKSIAVWIGSIVAAIVVEALLVRVAQRCVPGLFPQQQPQQPQQQRNRR